MLLIKATYLLTYLYSSCLYFVNVNFLACYCRLSATNSSSVCHSTISCVCQSLNCTQLNENYAEAYIQKQFQVLNLCYFFHFNI